MDINDFARVLYAPHKAFKRIIQKPSYVIPAILLIIFIIVMIGSTFILVQRIHYEQTMPVGDQNDVWTENSAYWNASSGTIIANDTSVFINGTAYYGTTSIQFTNPNTSNVSMLLSDIGPVDCGPAGFRNVSLSVQIVAPNATSPQVTLTLFSGSSSFSRNITSTLANSTSMTNVWYNLTVPLNTTDWASNGSPSWDSITGLKMDFIYPTNTSVNIIIDGLFFRGEYKTPYELNGLAYLGQLALSGASQFIFEWILLTGLMYLLLKGFKVNSVWKPLFISVGFTLIVLIIQYILLGVIHIFWPNLYMPLELLAGIPSEATMITQSISDQTAFVLQITWILQFIIWGWLAVLGTFVVRANSKTSKTTPSTAPVLPYQPSETPTTPQTPSTQAPSTPAQTTEELSWTKCAIVSVISLALTAIVLLILYGLTY